MHRADFSFDLPPELIAQHPLPERTASRLLLLDGATGAIQDSMLARVTDQLRSGDLLVLNDTRVLPARVWGRKETGGQVEIMLERPGTEHFALVHLQASKPIKPGARIQTAHGEVLAIERDGELWRVQLPAAALTFFELAGEMPLPPYIDRSPDAADRERYQTVFARVPGAVAAPTASLHFDTKLLDKIEALGVGRAFVTLHVGLGTFQPLRVVNVMDHEMHAEWYQVPAEAVAAIERTRASGGRIVAVGTTVARALESAAMQTRQIGRAGCIAPASGETKLFIYPGFKFQMVDVLLTNFHLSESTLLMLVCAFAGREHTLAAYRHAVAKRYRFFSYGDAMLVTPCR